MITTVTQLFIVQYSLRQQRQPRRFAICRQIATFPKAEFVAAHSRKGGICCGSQPQRRNLQRLTVCLSFSRRQRLMLFFINHRQHLCHRSVKLSRYLLTYVYRLIKPSCERTVFCDIYVMLLRNCNYPQWPVRLYPLPRQQALCRLSCGHI